MDIFLMKCLAFYYFSVSTFVRELMASGWHCTAMPVPSFGQSHFVTAEDFSKLCRESVTLA